VVIAAAFLGVDRTLFLPAPTTHAHQRVEAACAACHLPWEGPTAEQCLTCHERTLATDTHSPAVLAAPKNAGAIEAVNRDGCLACHKEHRESIGKGYTGPPDLCRQCHVKEKGANQFHKDTPDDSCATAGCHSFHSNLAADQINNAQLNRLHPVSKTIDPPPHAIARALSRQDIIEMRKGDYYQRNPIIAARYELSKHFGTEATCLHCHETPSGGVDNSPPVDACKKCHKAASETFVSGAHGAAERVIQEGGLGGRKVIPIGCGSCHDAHSLMLENARVNACLECHQTEHAKNYPGSGHARYLTDPVFTNNPLTGIDCAGCHMPHLPELLGHVDHNESLTVSSKERMANHVCSRCHGLYFSLSSLYNEMIVESNFTYTPRHPGEGVEYMFRNLHTPMSDTVAP
jgi:hypothetical protein